MSRLDVPGAQLFYEAHGNGPLLVVVPGASGTGASFQILAEQLTEHFTVLLYDRRGFSRSGLNGEQGERRLRTDAEDVRRLIDHVGNGSATLFGHSSGAIVALAVLADHPSVVRTLIVFEPPLMRLLPDGDEWIGVFDKLYELYRTAGVEPAQKAFRERVFPASDLAIMARAPRNDANAAYWFEHELRQYPRTELDLEALAAHADRILPALGRDGGGHPCHAATVELAGRLGRPLIELPGGHIGFHAYPTRFARDLTHALLRAFGEDIHATR